MRGKKIIAFILAAAMCFCGAGCKRKSGPAPIPEGTVTPEEEHLVTEGRLHDVTVTESSRPFVTDGESDYVILTAGDAFTEEFGLFIRRRVREATGGDIPTLAPDAAAGMTWSADAKYIVLGRTDMFAAAGCSMPDVDLGPSGYYIVTSGNSAFIMTAHAYRFGWQNAAIAFCRAVLGYDMLSDDTILYDKTGETLPDMRIIERPDFDFHIRGQSMTRQACTGMGFQTTDELFIRFAGANDWCHNVLSVFPLAEYGAAHPKWYSDDRKQMCYTAHGDETELTAFVDALTEKFKETLTANPTLANIGFMAMDERVCCECAACKPLYDKYCSSSAASIIRFMNRVDDNIQAWLSEEAEKSGTPKREVYLMFFAYQKSEPAPAVKAADGTYKPIDDTVKCNPHVVPFIAPIRADYTKSYYHPDNAQYRDLLEAWGACADRTYLWLYSSAVRCYFYPYNNWGALVDTYRFCKTTGAALIYPQGQGGNGGNKTNFNYLKEYVWSKIGFDVNSDYAALVDRFFEGYFGEAAKPMREFWEQLQSYLDWLAETYPTIVTGNIFDYMDRPQLWNKRALDGWMALCDEAYAAIEPLKTTDPERYDLLALHILRETLFPRMALLDIFPGSYRPSELTRLRREFVDDCNRLGYLKYSEYVTLEDMFANNWGM